MIFLYPNILYLLVAIAIPILIHLFNFRKPKRVYFTNVRFLRELKLESRKKSRLKHLIVLALRIIAYASIIIAFAGPRLIKKDEVSLKGKPLVLVYLDNSYSMQAAGKQGVLLEVAMKKAISIAQFYGPADEFYLITNDFSAKYSRIMNRSDFISMVNDIRYSPVSRSAVEIFERVHDIQKRNSERSITYYMISDFQTKTVDIASASQPEGIKGFLVPLTSTISGNLYLDSVWSDVPLLRPGQIMNLNARICNSGRDDAEEVPVSLKLNGKEVAVASVNVPANGNSSITLSGRIPDEGVYQGVVSIEDNPVIFDDRFHIGLRVTAARNILILSDEKERYLSRMFEGDSLFKLDVRSSGQLDYAALNRYDIVFLSGVSQVTDGMLDALKSYSESGGHLVVIPPVSGSDFTLLNKFLDAIGAPSYGALDTVDTRVSNINFDHSLYKGVYLSTPSNTAMPDVYSYYPILSKGSGVEEWIMKAVNDRPLLLSVTSGRGVVYMFAVPLSEDYSGLPLFPELFVPPVINMVLYSGVVAPMYYTVGLDKSAIITWDGELGENPFKVREYDGVVEFIPGHRSDPFGYLLFFEDQVHAPGNFAVYSGDSVIAPLAFNLKSEESLMEFDGEKVLNKWIKGGEHTNFTLLREPGKEVGDKLRDLTEGRPIWKIFIIIALIMLLFEAILLRKTWPSVNLKVLKSYKKDRL